MHRGKARNTLKKSQKTHQERPEHTEEKPRIVGETIQRGKDKMFWNAKTLPNSDKRLKKCDFSAPFGNTSHIGL